MERFDKGLISAVSLGILTAAGLVAYKQPQLEAARIEKCEYVEEQLDLVERALAEPQTTYHKIELNELKSELRNAILRYGCSDLKKNGPNI